MDLAGTWVGIVPVGIGGREEQPALVRVAVEARDDGPFLATLSVPDHGMFRLGATVTGEGTVTLFPAVHDVRVAPMLLGGGRFEREVELSGEELAALSGTYTTPTGATALVTHRGVAAETMPFVFANDEVVRLYPVAPGRLMSEKAETVTRAGQDRGRASLLFEADGARRLLAPADQYAEEAFAWVSGNIGLRGTLLLPHGDGPFPAVLLMHGTEPGTRDFYRMFAHHFVTAGIAALVFDKRGFGESGGNADSSWRDRAIDAAEGVRALRRHPRIDGERTGLWAFSNGTWSAPMVSGGIEPVRFVVLVGAAGVSPARAEIHRKLQELREWKVPNETLERVGRAWELAYACVEGTVVPNWEREYDSLIAGLHADPALTSIPLAEYAVKQPWLASAPPPFNAAQLAQMAFGQMPEMGIDPCADLEKTAAPVLFVIGEDDTNTPGREGAARVRAALDRAGNPHSRVELIPNAGHFLNATAPISGMSAAEAAGELHGLRFVPGYFELVTQWVREQVFRQ